MKLREGESTVDGEVFRFSEIPASILRDYEELNAGPAQLAILSVCVLNGTGPIGNAAEKLPLRIAKHLIIEILRLSEFYGNDEDPID